MLSNHSQTKQFKSKTADCIVVRDFITNNMNVRLNIGVDGVQLKSVDQINELIELLQEVREDVNSDVKRED